MPANNNTMHNWLVKHLTQDLTELLYFWLGIFMFWVVFGGGWGYLVVHLNLPFSCPYSPLRLPG